MRRYRFTYFLEQSFKGLWRNGLMTFASVTVLFSCLVVLGSFALLVTNIDANLEKLGLLNEIVAFVDFDEDKEREQMVEDAHIGSDTASSDTSDTASVDDIIDDTTAVDGSDTVSEELAEEPDEPAASRTREEEKEALKVIESQIKAIPGVDIEGVKLVTKEEALAEEKEKYKDYAELYAHFEQDNPLRDSFVIKYKADAEPAVLAGKIDAIEGIATVNSHDDLAKQVNDVKNGISTVLIIFLAILFVVSIFVIINTIKLALHSRRSEISIMRYIGATDWFIMLPFLLEGVIIGLLSGILAFFVEWYLYGYIVKEIQASVRFLHLLEFGDVAMGIGLAFAGVGVLTGVIGSIISTSKYLKA